MLSRYSAKCDISTEKCSLSNLKLVSVDNFIIRSLKNKSMSFSRKYIYPVIDAKGMFIWNNCSFKRKTHCTEI